MAKQLETRLRIAHCLYTMLNTHDICDIRVGEICAAVGISRTTFYSYFQDIYAVAEWFWEYSARDILSRIGTDYGWREGHLKMYRYMLEHPVFFAEKRKQDDEKTAVGHDYANQQSLELHVKGLEAKLGRPLTDDEMFQMSYISASIACMTRKWTDEGMKIAPEAMADLVASIIPPFAIDALGR